MHRRPFPLANRIIHTIDNTQSYPCFREGPVGIAIEPVHASGPDGGLDLLPEKGSDRFGSHQLALQKLPSSPAELPLDELVERVFPEDQSTLSEALDRFPLKNDLVECHIRVNGDQMPLRSLELKGRIWRSNSAEETSIIGIIREIPKANELYERIAEANHAIQEALEAREDAFRRADQKLKALAEEFASTQTEPRDAEIRDEIPISPGESAKKKAQRRESCQPSQKLPKQRQQTRS